MNISIQTIRMQNFLSFKDAYIDLSTYGFTQVCGENRNKSDSSESNGTGKSSLFEAICWSLTGETIRGVRKVRNLFTDDGPLVEIEFTCDDVPYKLLRAQDNSQYKTNLLIFRNGEDISGKGIRDSEQILQKLIPDLTPELIGSVIILGQGLPQRFTNNTPSGRKEVLEKLSKSDFMIEDLKTRIVKRKAELSSNQQSFLQEESKLIGKQQLLTSSVEKDTSDYENLPLEADLKNRLMELQKLIEVEKECVVKHKEEYEKARTQRFELNNEVIKLQASLSTISDTVTMKYSGEVSKISRKHQEAEINISNLTREINRIKSTKDVCPTCGQKIVGIVKPDTSKMEEELENNKTILEQCKNDISIQSATRDKEIKELSEKLIKEKEELEDRINDLLGEEQEASNGMAESTEVLNKHTTEESLVSLKLGQIETMRKTLSDRIQSQKEQLDKIQSEILYNKEKAEELQARLDVISKMSTYTNREFRGFLLTNIIEYIDKKAKTYCEDVFGNTDIAFTIDGNNLLISYGGKLYETLSGGEKQKVDIIIQLSIRDMLCTYLNFRCNIICFDEVFDNCDKLGCRKILNLVSKRLNDISGIFIITHHDDLDIPSDNYINVVKGEDNISYIER